MTKEDELIDKFFQNLEIQHQFYSIKHKQPILLIGEKHLYDALKELLEKSE